MENTENKALQILTSELSTLKALVALNVTAGTDVEALALQELEFLRMQMVTKPFIQECDPTTVVHALKYAIKNNLSLDPNANLVYLTPGSVKVGNAYVNVLEIKPTADGRLSIAYQTGTILDHKQPVVTKDENGVVTSAEIEILVPSVPSPRWEKISIDQSEFKRLRGFSHAKNARGKQDASTTDYSNRLYTSFNGGMDPEFACAKVVTKALKKRGSNMSARNKPFIKTDFHISVAEDGPLSYPKIVESTTLPTHTLNPIPTHTYAEVVETKTKLPNEKEL